ncbi:MAG: hypothetical protein LBJ00_08160 [Planctomycetaceae bacterium]|jgi:predicted RND superfamily exporter protein|nr:hypothetical protein [Planctomycetaceae bacterium]
MSSNYSISNSTTYSYSTSTKEVSRSITIQDSPAKKSDEQLKSTFDKNNKDTVEISNEGQEALLEKMGSLKKEVVTLKGFVTENRQIFKVYKNQSGETWKELETTIDLPIWKDLETESGRIPGSNDNNGVFSGSHNSYTNLGKMFGLKGTFSDKSSFLTSLNNLISKESKGLTKEISGILKKAGLGEITKKITFSEDAEGNIVVEGNISVKQKNKLPSS